MQTKTDIMKRIVDVVLTVLLLFLMAFQVTGDVLHEWIGIGMTVTLVLHHILNRKQTADEEAADGNRKAE